MGAVPDNTDVVIVGGGLAGLTAAAILAQQGNAVALFEAGEPGGRAASWQEGGFVLNMGPHALYNGGRAAAILRELNVPFSGGPPASQGYLLYEDERYPLQRGVERDQTIGPFDAAGHHELAALLRRIPEMDPGPLRDQTLAEWLTSEVRSPTVRLYLEAMTRLGTYAHAPETLSAGAALAQFQMGAQGVTYLDGGWQTLTDGLARIAAEAGAQLFFHHSVKSVQAEDGVWNVGLTDGSECRARSVILAVRPAMAARLLEGASTPLPEWSEEAVPARIACLDLALKELPNPNCQFVLGMDEPLYFSVHTASARLAPAGGAVVHVAHYLGAEAPEDPESVRDQLEHLMDMLQPGWRDVIAHQRFLPNALATNAVPRADRGGRRPGPAVPEAPGLFVAGDWVGEEGMLADAAVASAKRAAEQVMEWLSDRSVVDERSLICAG